MPINPTPTIPILTISVFPLFFDVYGFAPFSQLACFSPFFRIPGAFPGALATILSGAEPTGHLGGRANGDRSSSRTWPVFFRNRPSQLFRPPRKGEQSAGFFILKLKPTWAVE